MPVGAIPGDDSSPAPLRLKQLKARNRRGRRHAPPIPAGYSVRAAPASEAPLATKKSDSPEAKRSLRPAPELPPRRHGTSTRRRVLRRTDYQSHRLNFLQSQLSVEEYMERTSTSSPSVRRQLEALAAEVKDNPVKREQIAEDLADALGGKRPLSTIEEEGSNDSSKDRAARRRAIQAYAQQRAEDEIFNPKWNPLHSFIDLPEYHSAPTGIERDHLRYAADSAYHEHIGRLITKSLERRDVTSSEFERRGHAYVKYREKEPREDWRTDEYSLRIPARPRSNAGGNAHELGLHDITKFGQRINPDGDTGPDSSWTTKEEYDGPTGNFHTIVTMLNKGIHEEGTANLPVEIPVSAIQLMHRDGYCGWYALLEAKGVLQGNREQRERQAKKFKNLVRENAVANNQLGSYDRDYDNAQLKLKRNILAFSIVAWKAGQRGKTITAQYKKISVPNPEYAKKSPICLLHMKSKSGGGHFDLIANHFVQKYLDDQQSTAEFELAPAPAADADLPGGAQSLSAQLHEATPRVSKADRERAIREYAVKRAREEVGNQGRLWNPHSDPINLPFFQSIQSITEKNELRFTADSAFHTELGKLITRRLKRFRISDNTFFDRGTKYARHEESELATTWRNDKYSLRTPKNATLARSDAIIEDEDDIPGSTQLLSLKPPKPKRKKKKRKGKEAIQIKDEADELLNRLKKHPLYIQAGDLKGTDNPVVREIEELRFKISTTEMALNRDRNNKDKAMRYYNIVKKVADILEASSTDTASSIRAGSRSRSGSDVNRELASLQAEVDRVIPDAPATGIGREMRLPGNAGDEALAELTDMNEEIRQEELRSAQPTSTRPRAGAGGGQARDRELTREEEIAELLKQLHEINAGPLRDAKQNVQRKFGVLRKANQRGEKIKPAKAALQKARAEKEAIERESSEIVARLRELGVSP